jgi:hypothetical protein
MFVLLAGGFAKLQKATIKFVMSVRLYALPSVSLHAWKKSASTKQIFMKNNI